MCMRSDVATTLCTHTHPTYVRIQFLTVVLSLMLFMCFGCLRVVSSIHRRMHAVECRDVQGKLNRRCYCATFRSILSLTHTRRHTAINSCSSYSIGRCILVYSVHTHEMLFLQHSPFTSLHIFGCVEWEWLYSGFNSIEMCFTPITLPFLDRTDRMCMCMCMCEWVLVCFFFLHSPWLDTVKNAFDYVSLSPSSVIPSISLSVHVLYNSITSFAHIKDTHTHTHTHFSSTAAHTHKHSIGI